ncbi:pseudouridine synthase [Gilvimarinus xylanilyticus]|uniref:Pseudouridine synthase n=1 Tax=Gilvimarinus xylanilyticus TaxID=2944139 RepID=A0A9X2HVL2_9GAMM|nr:pseudouridine synthase [Gilvimarinus xylanilyticus]MCP8898990.1 pseudouridine synthase [Gilvimarinus xylanilyticus]
MKSTSHRLDRFISQRSVHSRSDVRLLLAQKRIWVDDAVADSISQRVTQFSHVVLDGVCLNDKQPVYLMLNKPKGVASATWDDQHRTVMDFIDHPQKTDFHIVGRLDFNTTGLMLLTNDGAWSRRISLPQTKLSKTYKVTLAEPLTEQYVAAFKAGIYFAYEDITTQPAHLEILTDYTARLTLVEGKYHQVKRMFGFFDNQVLALHRDSVGPFKLDKLVPGEWRALKKEEATLV